MFKNIKNFFNRSKVSQKRPHKESYDKILAKHSPYEISNATWKVITRKQSLEKAVYIKVPYAEKDKVKALGAHWDNAKKLWFIPPHANVNLFWQWLSTIEEPHENTNIRSYGFFIAQSCRDCWRCKKNTAVFNFLLPKHHQTKDYDDNDNPYWESFGEHSLLSYLDPINRIAIDCMQSFSTQYYLDSTNTGSRYYMNHCKFCNSKLGDFYTHQEPEGGFWGGANAEKIKLHWFDEAFEACGSFTQGVSGIDYVMYSEKRT